MNFELSNHSATSPLGNETMVPITQEAGWTPEPIWTWFHAAYPSFDYPSSVQWRVKIMKLLIMLFSLSSCYFPQFRSTYSPQHFVLTHQSICFL